jgi:type I restriction enzyme R subunit
MPIIRRPFVPFDEHRAVRVCRRNLPHWRQDGVTYFVTFRLADSIPEFVVSAWESEKILWLKAHGITYDGEKGSWQTAFERLAIAERQAFHEHFNQRVQSCLDRGLGECHLHTPACVEIVRAKLLSRDGGI